MDLSKRSPDLPWGDWGTVLIVSGSSRLYQGTVRATLAALRTGLDMVVVAAPEKVVAMVQLATLECETRPLAGEHFTSQHANFLERHKNQTLLMGLGMTESKTQVLVNKFIHKALRIHPGPMVLDCDVLRALETMSDAKKILATKTVILTPNQEELALLHSKPVDSVRAAAKKVAEEFQSVVVAKGEVDLVTDGQQVAESTGGSHLLGKGGMGDIFAGITVAILAHLPNDPFQAAQLASRLIKDAGERAVRQHGPGVLPSDVAALIDLRRVKVS